MCVWSAYSGSRDSCSDGIRKQLPWGPIVLEWNGVGGREESVVKQEDRSPVATRTSCKSQA